MIEIDGSYLEGGGQILRTSLALAAITQKPCRVYNIRAKRKNPGLRTQHLQGVRAIAKLCDAKVKGDFLGSTEIAFHPGELKGGRIGIQISTAGSVGLVFQVLSLPACFCERDVEIAVKGGATYGKFAPPVDYINLVLLPLLEKMGYRAKIDVLKHGFYPKGGAEVRMEIKRVGELKPLCMEERGEIKRIGGISLASKDLQRARVAERQVEGAESVLRGYEGETEIKTGYVNSLCPGSGLTLCAECENSFLGSDSLGERGKRAEEVGREAGEELASALASGACLDEHAADQILPFLALASGESEVTAEQITAHCRTNMWVIEKFLPVKFEVREGKERAKVICKKI